MSIGKSCKWIAGAAGLGATAVWLAHLAGPALPWIAPIGLLFTTAITVIERRRIVAQAAEDPPHTSAQIHPTITGVAYFVGVVVVGITFAVYWFDPTAEVWPALADRSPGLDRPWVAVPIWAAFGLIAGLGATDLAALRRPPRRAVAAS